MSTSLPSEEPDHSRHHSALFQFPTSDPYRAVRKNNSPKAESPSRPESELLHFRTDSDSSTKRLAMTRTMTASDSRDLYIDLDDPYASKRQLAGKTGIAQDRTHSYLPYSNHARDPTAQPASLYVDDEAPSMLGNGPVMSMLQDEYMNGTERAGYQDESSVQKGTPHLEPLPEITRRSKRRCCHLDRRYIVVIALFSVALVTLVWFFVWPRWPSFYFQSVSIIDGTTVACSNASMQASWELTMLVDNNANWVPTRIRDFSVTLIDANTGVVFARGQTGSMVLPPRQSQLSVAIPMDVAYSAASSQDTTWQDIGSCCVTKRDVGPEMQQNLNVAFLIQRSISGIAWKSTTVIQSSTFGCPPL